MTSSAKSLTTKAAKKRTKPSPVLNSSNLQTDSVSLGTGKTWVWTGFCGVCLRAVEALQPGGLEPRHIEDKSMHCDREIPSKISVRTVVSTRIKWTGVLIPDSVYLEAVAFNERHRDVLEDPKNDPLVRNNWNYFPAHDGNKVRRIYKPFEGLK